jgi:hypothetical protein
MKRSSLNPKPQRRWRSRSVPYVVLCVIALLLCGGQILHGQIAPKVSQENPVQESLAEQIQRLNDAMTRTQAQLEQSQRDMEEMRRQLAALQQQMANAGATASSPSGPASTAASASAPPAQAAAAIEDIRERQAIEETQVATQEQTKVESASKYPVKLSGLVLFNGFVNTRQVDMAATPTLALAGPGSTGASVRQTVLGVDARGPRLFGARSHADLRVDFDASAFPMYSVNGTAPNSSGAYDGSLQVRLRTANAALDWQHTQVFFSQDRPIFNPDAPDSLVAVAEPALAWSGNLWAWNPQVGVTHDISLGGPKQLRLQAALIDVGDAPVSVQLAANGSASTAEQSRWPGWEARVALLGSKPGSGAHLGVGGYFAPHRTNDGFRFNSWSGSVDYRFPLPARLELTGNVYRGLALGGLGAGAYKDYVYQVSTYSEEEIYSRALDDIGGWSQLKERLSERLELNAAFGLDEVFAGQLRPYAGTSMYQNLARNRSYTGNIIYSPSAYLLFSLEYRRLESSPVNGPTAGSNIIGVGAGYKF